MVCTVPVQGSEIVVLGVLLVLIKKTSAYSSFESKLFSISSHCQISSKYLFYFPLKNLVYFLVLVFKEYIPLFSSFY